MPPMARAGKCLRLPVTIGTCRQRAASTKMASSGSGRACRAEQGMKGAKAAQARMAARRSRIFAGGNRNFGRFSSSSYSARIASGTTGWQTPSRIASRMRLEHAQVLALTAHRSFAILAGTRGHLPRRRSGAEVPPPSRPRSGQSRFSSHPPRSPEGSRLRLQSSSAPRTHCGSLSCLHAPRTAQGGAARLRQLALRTPLNRGADEGRAWLPADRQHGAAHRPRILRRCVAPRTGAASAGGSTRAATPCRAGAWRSAGRRGSRRRGAASRRRRRTRR